MSRRSHILTTAALLAVCATPASAAPYESVSEPPPPSSIAAGAGAAGDYQTLRGSQDLRSPDAVDATAHRGLYEAEQGPYALSRDYGSPDAVDAARDLPPVQIPAPVVTATGSPSGGFDWGDASIGAAGMLGMFGIAAGSALLLTSRKRRRHLQIAAR
jgi:hypothetical protein